MKILLWHVHGSWTDAFVHGSHEYLLPALPEGGAWGLGRADRDWPTSVRDIHPDALADEDIDVVVLQRPEELAEAERLLGVVRRLCDRRAGLGGDGVLRLVRTAHVPDAAAVLGADLEATGVVRLGTVGQAATRLVQQRVAVDFATGWLRDHHPAG